MDKRYLIAVAVIIALVAGVIWWQRGAGKRQLAQCAELKNRRALLAVSGIGGDSLAQLDIAIRTCEETAETLGETVDGGTSVLAGCEVKRDTIEAEFRAYRSVSNLDAIQRNNKRQNIIGLTSDMVNCYRDAIEAAETVATLDAIRASIKKAYDESVERARCFYFGRPGCPTYGVNEDTDANKGHNERTGGMEQLEPLLAIAARKRDTLRTAERAAARDAAAANRRNAA